MLSTDFISPSLDMTCFILYLKLYKDLTLSPHHGTCRIWTCSFFFRGNWMSLIETWIVSMLCADQASLLLDGGVWWDMLCSNFDLIRTFMSHSSSLGRNLRKFRHSSLLGKTWFISSPPSTHELSIVIRLTELALSFWWSLVRNWSITWSSRPLLDAMGEIETFFFANFDFFVFMTSIALSKLFLMP